MRVNPGLDELIRIFFGIKNYLGLAEKVRDHLTFPVDIKNNDYILAPLNRKN